VLILPQIGGKIWTAIEKSTGKPFIYNNEVIKFRDVAMRGPWTSGGIEANYGIIGHTPNCATPVDYHTQHNEDGSASCYLGWLDLLTRTWWRIEVRLEADKAYFSTHSLWHNATALEQPYYHWMNVGIKAAGKLEFIYDGKQYLGHDGEVGDWPVNPQNGKRISFYEQNNFGSYKSYHVFGQYSDFFGAYWHDEDFGMGRYAPHDEKAGKKIWIWGLSPQGMIWEKLLTDNNGQYVEVQSGRLFNQAAEGSNLSPFKQQGFAPYATDSWTEYWFPVKETKGFVKANNIAVLNVKEGKIWLMALQHLYEKLRVYSGDKKILEQKISLAPLQVFEYNLSNGAPSHQLKISLGDELLEYSSEPSSINLNRPTTIPKDFDHNSAYGLWLQGKQLMHMREYAKAEEKLQAALQREPYHIPTLCDLAQLAYQRMHYPQALHLLKTALSINTYDGQANYLYGLVNVQLKNWADAKDGFDLAAMSLGYRSAAYTELAKLYFTEYQMAKAYHYAQKSLENNSKNYAALQLMSFISRELGQLNRADSLVEVCLSANPFNPIARAEKMFNTYARYKNSALANAQLKQHLRSELPEETILECQAYYTRFPIAMNWFDVYSSPAIVFHNREGVEALLEQKTPYFPFRPETAQRLEEAISKNPHWKLKYYLALAKWHLGDLPAAQQLLEVCGAQPDEAVFYAARAEFFQKDPARFAQDMEKARTLDPHQWRYGQAMIKWYIQQKQTSTALQLAESYLQKHPKNYYLGLLYAKTLLLNAQYTQGLAYMRQLQVLPNEGATAGREVWKETNLMLAVQHIKNQKYEAALTSIQDARLWPENLGVGKPYPEDIDERLEDYLEAFCLERLNKKPEASALYSKAKSWKAPAAQPDANDLLLKFWPNRAALRQALLNGKLNDTENRRVLLEWGK
jgi:Tfp pilus assembly protein PilF